MIRDHRIWKVKITWKYHPRISTSQDESHTDYSIVVLGEATKHIIARQKGYVLVWVEANFNFAALPGSLVIESIEPIILDAYIEEHTY